MATTFSIAVANRSPVYAQQAAAAAFSELERLEKELSRFIETSDIARANRLVRGEKITIGDDTLQCLLTAAEVSGATQGAFDVAYASAGQSGGGRGDVYFALDPSAHTIPSCASHLRLA